MKYSSTTIVILLDNSYVSTSGTEAFPPAAEFKFTEYVYSEPEPEKRAEVWYRGSDFMMRSGRIRMVWDYWWEKWVFWEAPKHPKMPFQAVRTRFPHRFRGINRGRHWDRKAKKRTLKCKVWK